LRNHSAPKQSFLATSKSEGDADQDSLFVELSPDETTNKLDGNGSWEIEEIEGSNLEYNLINKEFNSGDNFLSLANSKTAGGNGHSKYLQVVAEEDDTFKKDTTGLVEFTGPYN